MDPETLTAQALAFVDNETGGVVPPIHTSTTYARDEQYRLLGTAEYTRDENPTYRRPELLLAELEKGADARLFASGMAAATTAVQALVAPGKRLVASRAMYHGFRLWLREHCQTHGIDLVLVDATDLVAMREAVTANTALVWIETPANPTWDVVDIHAVAEIAHAASALAVDSTVATPVHTRAITLGADLVMHSATKGLNGHSDVLAGALVTARDDDAWKRIRHLRHMQGAVLGPMEASLLLRGMRTLFVRTERSSATALALATTLSTHPAIERVLYPGLPSHPGHAIAAKQMHGGFGGLLSIQVRGGGGAKEALAVAAAVKLFVRATSLGGVESLIEHRATVEGPQTLAPPNLLRLSIGLESVKDLTNDLLAALAVLTR